MDEHDRGAAVHAQRADHVLRVRVKKPAHRAEGRVVDEKADFQVPDFLSEDGHEVGPGQVHDHGAGLHSETGPDLGGPRLGHGCLHVHDQDVHAPRCQLTAELGPYPRGAARDQGPGPVTGKKVVRFLLHVEDMHTTKRNRGRAVRPWASFLRNLELCPET
jgi:hypothetical protein